MIKFRNISEIEKLYPYVKAVAGTDVYNGDFGTVTEGTFALAANAKQVVMNIEVGDDEGLRVLDLDKLDGKELEIYGKQIPTGVAKGDKLKSTATGDLVKGATAAPYVEVTEIIGNHKGIVVGVVASAPATQSVSK